MSRWSSFLRRVFTAVDMNAGKKRKFVPFFETLDERIVPAAPSITSPTPTTATVLENVPYVYTFTATDSDGDVMFISGSGVPSWLTLSLGASGTATLSGTPGDNQGGTSANITITVTDGNTTPVNYNFTLNVTQVNDEPVRTAGTLTNRVIAEDSANNTAVSLGLTGLTYGGGGSPEASQVPDMAITITHIPSYLTLFAGSTAIAEGPIPLASLQTLSYKTKPDQNIAFDANPSITWTVQDNGGTSNGGDNELTESLLITVTAVNDEPAITGSLPAPISVTEEQHTSTAVSLGLASITAYSPGPSTATDETGQVTITITNIPGFITLYQLDGTPVNTGADLSISVLQGLTYKTVIDGAGTDFLTWTVKDNGGTANGGDDTRDEKITITVTGSNDAPVQTAGTDPVISVLEDSNNNTAISLGLGAFAYSPGGGVDEASQTLTYRITNIPSYITLFQSNGVTQLFNNTTLGNGAAGLAALQGLKYKTVPEANIGTGPADTLRWTITDSQSGSVPDSLTITVTAVNDQPQRLSSAAPTITVLEDSVNSTAKALISISGGLVYGNGGGAPETSQTRSYPITGIPSYINLYLADGSTRVNVGSVLQEDQLKTLVFKTIAEANGSGAVTWQVLDSGGTANGGNSTFNDSVGVVVTAVNDRPTTKLSESPVVDNNPNAVSVGAFQLGQTNYNVGEEGGTAIITVLRTGGTMTTATVNYATSNNTAVAGIDYTAVSGTLTFNPGVVSQTISVPLLNNAHFQGDRIFNLSLSSPTVAPLGPVSSVGVLIRDDETQSIIIDEDANNNTAASLNFTNLNYYSGGGTDEVNETVTINITNIPPSILLFQANGTPVTTGTILGSVFRGLTYKTVPNSFGNVALTWTVTDGSGGANRLDGSLIITVTSVNDNPVRYPTTLTMPAINVNEDNNNTTAITLGLGAFAYDQGGGSLESGQTVTRTLTSYPSTILTLYHNDGATITAASLPITLNNAQLQGLKYRTLADANGTGNIVWTVSDGVGGLITETLSVNVNPINDAPTLLTGSLPTVSVLEDAHNTVAVTLPLSALTYGNGGVNSLESSQALTYTLTSVPNFINVFLSNGTAVTANTVLPFDQLIELQYKTVADGFGTDNLVWTVVDDGGTASGGKNTLLQTISVTVSGTNETPVRETGADINLEVDEDIANSAPMTLGLGGYTYNPGGGTFESVQALTYKVTNVPDFIKVYLADGVSPVTDNTTISSLGDLRGLTFKTLPDANGSEQITWTVTDNGATPATLPQALTITVKAINDPPARTGTGTITALNKNEDSALTSAVSLLLSGVTYGYGGGLDESSQAPVINITNIPAAISLYQENGATAVSTGTIQSTVFQNLTFKTNPDANTTGAALTWTVSDGVDTILQTLSVIINPVNDEPKLTSGSLSTITITEDSAPLTAVPLGLTGLDYGPGGGDDELSSQTLLTITISAVPAALSLFKSNGTTSVTTGTTLTLAELLSLTYKTNLDGAGNQTLSWTVQDGGGTALGGDNSLDQSVTISITGLNDAPKRTAGTLPAISINEDSAPSAVSLGLSGFNYGPGGGIDEATQNVTFKFTSLPNTLLNLFKADGTPVLANVTLTLNELKGLTYKTVANASGTETIVWTALDDGGTGVDEFNQLLVPETLNITVTAVNDTPSIIGSLPTITTWAEDSNNDTAISLGLSSITGYSSGESGQTITAITITGIPAAINLFHGNGMTTVSTNASLSLESLQTLTFRTKPDANGTGALTWTVKDSSGASNDTLTESLTITITSINDPPVRTTPVGALAAVTAAEDSANTTATTLGLSSVNYNAGGGETQPLTITITAVPSYVSLFLADATTAVTTGTILSSVTALQGLKYRTSPNVSGTGGALTWTVKDNGGSSPLDTLTESLSINITSVNDTPSIIGGSLATITVQEDSANVSAQALGLAALAFGPGLGDTGQTFTITVTSIPTALTLYKSDGTTVTTGTTFTSNAELQGLTYRTTSDLIGTGTLGLSIKDSGGTANAGDVDTLTANLTISVAGINDRPTFSGTASPINIAEDSQLTATTLGLSGLSYGPGGGSDETGQSLTITFTNIPATLQLFQADNSPVLTSTTLNITQFQGLTYKTATDKFGSDTLAWTVRDSGGGTDNITASILVTVTAVNDKPSILPTSTVTFDEGTVMSLGSAITISDADSGDLLTVTLTVSKGTLSTGSSTGSLLTLTGTQTAVAASIANLKFTPANNFDNGLTTLTITAADAIDAASPRTLQLDVKPVNNKPTFTVTTKLVEVSQGLGAQSITGFAAFDSGAPNEAQTATYQITSVSKPSLFLDGPSISSDGTLTFTPASGIGSSTFLVTVSDGSDVSASQKITISVIKPNFNFVDGDLDKVNVRLSGPGGVIITKATDGSIESIVLSNTDSTSKLNISVKKVGDGFVNIGSITGSGSLSGIAAPQCDFTGGGIAIAGSIGSVIAHSFTAGSIEATGLSSLTVAAGFAADVTLTGLTGTAATLGKVAISGGISGGTWTVPGRAQGITINGVVDQWALNVAGDLASLKMQDVEHADVTVDGNINGGVTAQRWSAGGLQANTLKTLSITGKKATLTTPVIPGDFTIDLNLTATTGLALGGATIAGALGGNTWQIDSDSGPITVTGDVDGWTLNVDGNVAGLTVGNVVTANVNVNDAIKTLKAMNWADGTIEADSIGKMEVNGTAASNFTASMTLNGTGVVAGGKALGTMSVQGAISSAIISIAGNVGSITAGRVLDSKIFVGYDGSGFTTDYTLGALTVKGLAGVTGASLVNSTVAAATLTSATVNSVDTSVPTEFVIKSSPKIIVVSPAFHYPVDTDPMDQFSVTVMA